MTNDRVNFKSLSPTLSRKSSTAGHDNLGFDISKNRKVSTASQVSRKIALHKLHELEGHQEPHITVNDSDRNCNAHADGKANSNSTPHSETANNRSWWYSLCLKCQSKEDKDSWQPIFWSKLFPQPFFPSYRKISRLISMILIGALCWYILYTIVGDVAAPPDGELFQLIILSISAFIGGWLVSLTTLPALVGMLFVGIIFQNVNIVDINDSFTTISKHLSNFALVIILTRAGLDMDHSAMKKLKFDVLKLSLLPWLTEASIVALLSKCLLELSWEYSILLGSIVAAVAPAVVIPCLFRLREEGYGVAKSIPTLIIAVASINDTTSVAIFGIIKGMVFSQTPATAPLILGIISIFGGIAFGIVWGVFCSFAPERNDPFKASLRILLLLAGGTGAVFGSDLIGYGGAGPLACITAAFVALYFWSSHGWSVEDNPVATAFEIFWMVFQPILFGITGARIKLKNLEGSTILVGIGLVVAGVAIRICVTILLSIGSRLNLKEKVFISITWMCKGIVQAALGPIAISMIDADEHPDEYIYSKKILTICILSILLTAPTGALLTILLGPHLLTKAHMLPLTGIGRKKKTSRISLTHMIIREEEKEDENPNLHPSGNPKIVVTQ